MVRVLAVLLALGVGFDHYALDGKYTRVAKTVIHSLISRI